MTKPPVDLTLEELQERARLAGLPIPESRLKLLRGLVGDALRPLRADGIDGATMRAIEPAVTFDAVGGAKAQTAPGPCAPPAAARRD